jgi:uncharacterized protein (DUF58 family)
MFTGRGLAVAGGALLLWLGARILGAPDLHVVSVGLLVLVPFAAALVRWHQHELTLTRRLSTRRAFLGSRVRVDLELRNAGRSKTSVLLLEDRLPPSLGRGARAVLAGIPPRGKQTVSYSLICRSRGRYLIGPLAAHVSDPFDLARRRLDFHGHQELIVYPEVEDLRTPRALIGGVGSGESTARQVFRTGDEFYAMRGYEIGDDLRRIHWPSTARTGELMIRQDEAARRAMAVLFLDTRVRSVGGKSDAFERAVSAAASIGSHYLRAGFSLRLATPDLPPHTVSREALLEILAVASASRTRLLTPSLLRLRGEAAAGATLVAITHLLLPEEIPSLTEAGASYGPRIAILVYPHDPEALPPERRAEMQAWAQTARTSLARSGWDVVLLSPRGKLADVWQKRATKVPRTVASSF